MSLFTIESEIDLGDIGFHHLDLSASIKDDDPESAPRIEIKRAVASIDVNGRETKIDVTERIALKKYYLDLVLQKYESAKEQLKFREPDDDPYTAA